MQSIGRTHRWSRSSLLGLTLFGVALSHAIAQSSAGVPDLFAIT
jgi:hypothetical protein